MVLDILLYFLIFNFLLAKRDLDLGVVVISAEIASFLIVFPIVTFTGLWLGRNISFAGSPLSGRVQTVRYLIVVGCNIAIKYLGLKLFIDILLIYPSIANAMLTIISILFSYFAQSRFSFRGSKL